MTPRRGGPRLRCPRCARKDGIEPTGRVRQRQRFQAGYSRPQAEVVCECGRAWWTWRKSAVVQAFDVTQGQSVVYEQPALGLAS